MELIRRACVAGYRAVGLADHGGLGSLSRFAQELSQDCALARDRWRIMALPGVELTHVPAAAVAEVARAAKEAGLWLVIVHGETISEPVEEGTNLAAVSCDDVDILAHPGLITLEEAELAARNGVFLELSAKPAHAAANGQVAKMARLAGAKLIVNSDSHELDFLSEEQARRIALAAGLEEKDLEEVLRINPQLLLEKILAGRIQPPR
jgi:histidinol phosphatase-like PHP family hydrolase